MARKIVRSSASPTNTMRPSSPMHTIAIYDCHPRRRARHAPASRATTSPPAPARSVAVALFASGERVLSRSIKYHRPRGFFCLAGHCGACLMRIDGKPNVQGLQDAGRTTGCAVERQNAFPSGGFDVLGAADFFFPKGMDHHTMMTSPRALNAVMQKVVRQLGGLGQAARRSRRRPPSCRSRAHEHVDVAVVGGGPAGLAAATDAARAPASETLLVDEQDRAGRLVPGASALRRARRRRGARRGARGGRRGALVARRRSPGIPRTRRTPGAEPGLLAVHTPDGPLQAHRRALRLRDRRLRSERAASSTTIARACCRRAPSGGCSCASASCRRSGRSSRRRPLRAARSPRRSTAPARGDAHRRHREQIVAANGHALGARGRDDRRRKRSIECDLVAVAALPAPASELPRQHGVAVALRPTAGGFACRVDDDGARHGRARVRLRRRHRLRRHRRRGRGRRALRRAVVASFAATAWRARA